MLPKSHLFPTSDNPDADADNVAHALAILQQSEGWANVCSSIERHIGLLHLALEASADNAELIRGRIAAYRDVLAFPVQVVDHATTATKR